MSEYRIRLTILLLITVLPWQVGIISADTWRLQQGNEIESISPQGQDRFMWEVAEIKKLVNSGQAKAAREAFDKLKKDHPDIAGPDFDAFIEAEILFCEGKFTKAVRTYDKLLIKFPQSQLTEAALSRQFEIATAFLAGRKVRVLRFFKIKGYDTGAKIMERITDKASDSSIGINASVSVAKNYEKRKKFNEAYLKWQDISIQWKSGQTARDSLLAMARCKHSVYNSHPEHKRPMYDASCLNSAKTYYERFKSQYQEDARKIGADKILKEINEQQAYKQYTIGKYYEKTGNRQAANLYYDMVLRQWPGSNAAEMSRQILSPGSVSEEINK